MAFNFEMLTPNALRARIHASVSPSRVPLIGHLEANSQGEDYPQSRPGSHRAPVVHTPEFKVGLRPVAMTHYNHPMMGVQR